MTTKFRNIDGRGRPYRALCAGLVATGTLAAAGGAQAQVPQLPASYVVATYTNPVNATTTQHVYSGKSYFSAMCYDTYNGARANGTIPTAQDVPNSCANLDRLINAVPVSFLSLGVAPNRQNDGGNQWSGNNDDAEWIDPNRSFGGQKSSYTWNGPSGMDAPNYNVVANGGTIQGYYGQWGQNAAYSDQYYNAGNHFTAFNGNGSLDNGSPNPDGTSEIGCNTVADCPAPSGPANGTGTVQFYLPAQCRTFPGVSAYSGGKAGVCRWNNYRFLLTGTYYPTFDNQVNLSAGKVKFGNSNWAGSWAGAGTDGDTNWVLFQASNTIMPGLLATQWGRMFAGVHIVSTTMNIFGSMYQDPFRGQQIGLVWDLATPTYNTNIATSWDAVEPIVPQASGTSCGGSTPTDYTNGGGHGFNGCGCHLSMVTDDTAADSTNRLASETFAWLDNDSHDVKLAAYYNYKFICNYNATAFPWNVGVTN
jgi:hypothetical protein